VVHLSEQSVERIVRGDVWIVEPLGFPKPRPVVVVSIDPVNDLRPDVLVVPVTSKPGPLRVALPDRTQGTGLEAASHAKCESVGPVHKTRLKRRIGRLPRAVLTEVERGLARVLGLPGVVAT
jgi:mRNA-degrading endonuclease toxin of MazEF toxin-antitoxin module